MNLIVDVGNTRAKAAVFEQDILVELFVIPKNRILSELKKIIKKNKIDTGILSNVGNISDEKVQKIKKLTNFIELSSIVKVPFINLYKTPKTLGVDRIALATAAIQKYPAQNTLVVDCGTCITYDFISQKKEYFGGAISPGIAMRYNALHKFTSKLPLLEAKNTHKFIGSNTEESIHSGVINGVLQEIKGVITQYEKDFPYLTVVLTGGDTNFLSKQLKSSIFANQNFLLEGLNEILIFNNNE